MPGRAAAVDEFAAIARYFTGLGPSRPDVTTGVGDDAAVLAPPAGQALLLTTDTLVSGRHFPEAGFPPEALGHRALAVNLSDIAAMAGEPAWALLSLTLPGADEAWLDEFAAGFGALARRTEVALVGGNLASGPLSVTVTLAGFVPAGEALLRSGARAGDALFVTGALGGGASGLRAFQAGVGIGAPAVAAFARPEPRVRAGRILSHYARAAIDVSDGLVGDLGKLLAASGGLGADLEADAIPLAAGACLDDALGPSDDYELLLSVPADAAGAVADLTPERLGCTLRRIGTVRESAGIRLDGRPIPSEAELGFRHFR